MRFGDRRPIRKVLEIKPDYLPAHSALIAAALEAGDLDAAGKQLAR
jgi:hypothetical protein